MKVKYTKGSRDFTKLSGKITDLARQYAQEVQRLYVEEATGTWDHQPVFTITDLMEGDTFILNVAPDPDADEEAYHIFRYVDEGTDVRYAAMTNPFVPKSAPGRLRSGPGVGGFLELSFPRPGIAARKFGAQIVEQLNARFVEDMRSLIEG